MEDGEERNMSAQMYVPSRLHRGDGSRLGEWPARDQIVDLEGLMHVWGQEMEFRGPVLAPRRRSLVYPPLEFYTPESRQKELSGKQAVLCTELGD